jgi:hypothetical protein
MAKSPIDPATSNDDKIKASRWNFRKFIDVFSGTSFRRIGWNPS